MSAKLACMASSLSSLSAIPNSVVVTAFMHCAMFRLATPEPVAATSRPRCMPMCEPWHCAKRHARPTGFAHVSPSVTWRHDAAAVLQKLAAKELKLLLYQADGPSGQRGKKSGGMSPARRNQR